LSPGVLGKVSSKQSTVYVIAGPTASGKSARAIEMAQKLGGVVINCDSVQLYDGLPTLTAQPSYEDMEKVPHLLYGALHPNAICSAGDWCKMVRSIIEETLAAEQTPIVTGGTGLYIKALMEGLSPIPDIPEDVRLAARQKQRELGNPAFHEALKYRDSAMAERLHSSNTARIVRAWEVLEHTGRSLADWQKEEKDAPPAHWHFEVEVIMPEREELYRRCNERFVKMLEAGALEEVEDFGKKVEKGEVESHVPLTKALGFLKLWQYLKVEISREEAITLAQGETRRYAKRQVTWFRHQL